MSVGRFKDLTGLIFGSLTVIKYLGKKSQPSGKSKSLWLAKCSCGLEKSYTSDRLTSGRARSCGCQNPPARYLHGWSTRTTYNSWNSMTQRCTLPTCHAYPKYGGNGISCCDRWLEPEGKGFLNFLEDMGERPTGTSLNRIKGAKIYSKETCEWANLSVQAYDTGVSKNNTSGRTGVSRLNGKIDLYAAYIWKDSKKIHLGTGLTFEEACRARQDAELFYYGWTKK